MEYKYLNLNILGKEEEDCVTRAISLATGLSYAEVQDKLYYIAQLFDCEQLCVCCYQHLLDNVFKFDKIYCKGMTVEEFANQHRDGTYILRMNGHLSCLIDNVLYDIWDCRYKELTDVWKVE